MSPDELAQELNYGDAVRRQIEHEDILIVNRLSWLMASQAFLFSGYAILLSGPMQMRSTSYAAHAELLMKIIPLLAISASLLIYLGICGGVLMMARLRREMVRNHAAIGGLRPPVQGGSPTLLLGHAAPLGLPPLFAVAWAILLFTR
jgi:hypothetical protein